MNGLQGAETAELSSVGLSRVKEREAQLQAGPGPSGAQVAPRELPAVKVPVGRATIGQGHRKGPWVLSKASPFSFLDLPHDLF